YVCGGYNKYGKTICTDHLIKEKDLIEFISNDLQQKFSEFSVRSVQMDIERELTKITQHNQKRLLDIQRELEKIKKDKTGALRLKIRGEISDEEYRMLVDDNSE